MRVTEVHQIAKAMVLETDPAYLRSLTNGGTRQVLWAGCNVRCPMAVVRCVMNL
jgi:hypothetical protein